MGVSVTQVKVTNNSKVQVGWRVNSRGGVIVPTKSGTFTDFGNYIFETSGTNVCNIDITSDGASIRNGTSFGSAVNLTIEIIMK